MDQFGHKNTAMCCSFSANLIPLLDFEWSIMRGMELEVSEPLQSRPILKSTYISYGVLRLNFKDDQPITLTIKLGMKFRRFAAESLLYLTSGIQIHSLLKLQFNVIAM